MAKKTDNANLTAKLELRRYFLRRYHADAPPDVLDCCQGEGVLWKHLREEFELASYWGLDVKPRRGRLMLDSRRVLAQPGWTQNVIDVDTYGSQWRHYDGILRNARLPVTVFLTIGQVSMGVDRQILVNCGLDGLKIPPGIARKVSDKIGLSHCLTRCYDFDIMPIEAVESVVSGGTARYVGVRLQKK